MPSHVTLLSRRWSGGISLDMEVWHLLSITNQLGRVAALSGLAINVEGIVCKHCTGTKLFQPITTWVAWKAWPHQTSNTDLLSHFEVYHLRSYFFHHSHNLMPVHMHHQSTLIDSFCVRLGMWKLKWRLKQVWRRIWDRSAARMWWILFNTSFWVNYIYDITTTSWSTLSAILS